MPSYFHELSDLAGYLVGHRGDLKQKELAALTHGYYVKTEVALDYPMSVKSIPSIIENSWV
ncbi:hypothetical protein HYV81_01050 [Candidatus Woesearchaeota archaeon]|nr:hypothetical protein [Candidatus Woesearchaeota archaeon]